MPRSTRSLIFTVTIITVIILLVYIYLLTFPGRDTLWHSPHFHFYVLSPSLFALAISAIVVGWTGIRLRDISIIMLALAIFSLSGFFLIHALSTPGFLIHNTHHVAGVSSQFGVTMCAVWILLSTLPSDHFFIRIVSMHRKKIVIGWIAVIAILIAVSLLNPHISEFIPIHIEPLNYIIGIITSFLYLWAGKRYYQQFKIVHFPLHAAIVIGSVLLVLTEFVMITTQSWTLVWWFYHVILGLSALMLLYGVIAQYRSNISITHTFHQENTSSGKLHVSISSSMQNLIVATETKDQYTAGHNYRVAIYSLQLAKAMNLDSEQLQALVRGGIIHDVGKTQIPSEILNKPGQLDAYERTVIEHHPVSGYEMCKYIGFMTEELSVIRHHHEKWDGTGYPDNLKGTEIPLLARILAIADVYDALTSRRSYRDPWSHESALQVIIDGSGTHFDPECVSTFVRLCNRGGLVVQETNITAPLPNQIG